MPRRRTAGIGLILASCSASRTADPSPPVRTCSSTVTTSSTPTAKAHTVPVSSGETVCTCIDISKPFLAKAREACREVSNVDFQLCRGDYLEALPAAGFDRGYSWNLFIHLDAYQVFHYLRGAARILRPGGRFAVNFISLGDRTRPLFRMFADAYPTAWPEQLPGFLRWYEPELMVAIAGEAGLAPLYHSGEGGSHVLTLHRPDADG